VILSYDEAGEILDAAAEELPEIFFEGLTGGVLLLEEDCPDPEAGEDMYILGEYCEDELGCYIRIYYGSFVALFEDETREVWEEELRITLRHELTHHVEGMAGAFELDRKDEEYLMEYLREQEEHT